MQQVVSRFLTDHRCFHCTGIHQMGHKTVNCMPPLFLMASPLKDCNYCI